MRYEFIKQQHSERLTLLFAGWAMSAKDFDFLSVMEDDLLVCSDYRVLEFDESHLTSYVNVRLIGYSMGVWAASFLLRNRNIPFSERIAINGTMFPVDDKKGIPIPIYEGTKNGLTEESLQKFYRRMCGARNEGIHFLQNTEAKNIRHLQQELAVLFEASKASDAPTFDWDSVIISTNDYIFPTLNQRQAWQQNSSVRLVEAPHFSHELFKQIV